ncbi:MAG: hypothetical protein ACKO7W_22775 [Elainella sp.]
MTVKPMRMRATRLPSGIWLGLLVTLIGLLSFRIYAAHLAPDLDSDSAIHILMAADLRLPQDLYYWGQDRLGSLLPLLAHALLKLTPLTPAEAIAAVQYFLLAVGYLCLSSLFQTRFARLAFAVVWFLPIFDFRTLVVTAHPYGPQFALIGLALVLVNQMLPALTWASWRRNLLRLGLIAACLMLGVWVSDFSILFIAALVVLAIARVLRRWFRVSVDAAQTVLIRAEIPQVQLRRLGLMLLAGGLLAGLGLGLIGSAKQTASAQNDYARLTNLAELQTNLGRLVSAWWQTVSFRANPFLSCYALLITGLLVYWAYALYRSYRQRPAQPVSVQPVSVQPVSVQPISDWVYFFAGSALMGFLLLITAWWVYENTTNLRYFVPVYVTGWMAALLLVEQLSGRIRRISLLLIGLIVLCSLASQPQSFALPRPVAKVEQFQPLTDLGKAGFIGDYWSSYILCTANPDQLACTSHDLQNRTPCDPASAQITKAQRTAQRTENHRLFKAVRCARCARRVLRAKSIYLVERDWLPEFPPEMQQFGQCLVKTGEPQTIAGYRMAPYRVKRLDGPK